MTPLPNSRLGDAREAEVYAAVLELLGEHGYEALTMDAVAARAKTSKATIYRQWNGKPGLVVAALQHMKEQKPSHDTGTLRGDLLDVAETIGAIAQTNGQLFAAVSHAMNADPELGCSMRECMFEPSTGIFYEICARAIAREEIDEANPAIEHVAGLFLSSVVARPLIDGVPVDEKYLTVLVDSVILPALQANPATPTTATATTATPSPKSKKRS